LVFYFNFRDSLAAFLLYRLSEEAIEVNWLSAFSLLPVIM
jgi:hypothetical protein